MEYDCQEASATADSGEVGGVYTHICGEELNAIIMNSKTC